MFGYVRIYKPELKIKDYEIYKGFYCSLCKELGKNYGLPARMVLNYDFTFLALLQSALSENCPGFKKSRCTFNPTKKCLKCSNEALKTAAAGAVIISYYKAIDNIADEKTVKKILAFFGKVLLKRAWKKARKNYPKIDSIIKETMTRQFKLEKENCKSIDMAAEPTANAMSIIFGEISENNSDLKRLGYCLGKYIYTIDAAADLADDYKRNRYNPYITENMTEDKIKEIRENAVKLLNFCISEAINSYKKLTVLRYADILENILYDGLYFTMNDLLFNGGKENGKSL